MKQGLTCMWLCAGLGLMSAAHGQTPNTPCGWFDHNGDGILGANTWLYVLGQYGTSTGEMDIDDNGMVDLRDFLQFLPYFGEQCPIEWADTTSGHILDVLLVEHAVHDAELAGLVDTLPAGSVTYWLYAQLAEPTDGILSMYGDDAAPLTLETDGSFYGFGTGPGEAITLEGYNPIFNSFVPANEFMTWFTLDEEPGDNWNTPSAGFITGTADATNGMAEAGLIQINDPIGGGSFFQSYCCQSGDGFILLGQFTVVGTTTFSGTVNLIAETAGSTAIEFAEGMTFSSGDLAVLGCMDPQAINFDQDATHEPLGACAYAGDFNGDGEFTVEDLLELLADFGCTTCPQGDLNGDGVVSVQDILLF
ncbi:MAG: hypothetical protein ACO2ZL_09435, partial [Flavobacteriales bacterium]